MYGIWEYACSLLKTTQAYTIAYNDTNKSPLNTKANFFYLGCGCLLEIKKIKIKIKTSPANLHSFLGGPIAAEEGSEGVNFEDQRQQRLDCLKSGELACIWFWRSSATNEHALVRTRITIHIRNIYTPKCRDCARACVVPSWSMRDRARDYVHSGNSPPVRCHKCTDLATHRCN